MASNGHLVLVRGLPGAGKSTFAQLAYPSYVHEETDKRMYKDGVYVFQGAMLKDYHSLTQLYVQQCLRNGQNVVVSNTFTQHWELRPYLEMSYASVTVYSLQTPYTPEELAEINVHNCPAEAIVRMAQRWEPFQGEYEVKRG